jgi:hypothetical protein
MRKIREPRLAHAQQQLCQTSRTTPSPILSPTALWPGRGIGVAFPQRVEREALLGDHRDGGQRHAQAGREADKVLLLELVRRGGGVGVPAVPESSSAIVIFPFFLVSAADFSFVSGFWGVVPYCK